MSKEKRRVPKLRFPGFTEDWEQRKLGDLYKRVNERNDGTLGRDKWISVAKMYFQDPDKVQSNNLDTRTYVMKKGDIAFEGHPNNEFKFGRFVLNDIGTGIISELFPIYRPITEYDLDFWKYAIQLERVMAPIFAKSITSSGNSSNKLDHNHFLNQELLVPNIEEQKKIGTLLSILSKNITLHQRKLDNIKLKKKALLQKLFPKNGERYPELRFPGFTDAWEQCKLKSIANTIVAGGDIDKNKIKESGTYPVIANALTKDGVVGYYEDTYRIEAPAVTVTGRGDIGVAKARHQNFTPVVRLLSLTTAHDVDFIENAINNLKIVSESTGVAQLTVPQLSNYKIHITSILEERKIGLFISKVDNLITLHQRKLDHLQLQKKALLQQMFV